VLAGIALGGGGTIYLLWRPTRLHGFEWLETLGLTPWVDALRIWAWQSLPAPADWQVYSLPTALWAFGCLLLIHDQIGEPPVRVRTAMATFLGYALASEVGQALGPVPGTFDGLDLCAIASGTGIALLWIAITARQSGESTWSETGVWQNPFW
jgi:hypothetical protein